MQTKTDSVLDATSIHKSQWNEMTWHRTQTYRHTVYDIDIDQRTERPGSNERQREIRTRGKKWSVIGKSNKNGQKKKMRNRGNKLMLLFMTCIGAKQRFHPYTLLQNHPSLTIIHIIESCRFFPSLSINFDALRFRNRGGQLLSHQFILYVCVSIISNKYTGLCSIFNTYTHMSYLLFVFLFCFDKSKRAYWTKLRIYFLSHQTMQ